MDKCPVTLEKPHLWEPTAGVVLVHELPATLRHASLVREVKKSNWAQGFEM